LRADHAGRGARLATGAFTRLQQQLEIDPTRRDRCPANRRNSLAPS
jgi:hypothetical protein